MPKYEVRPRMVVDFESVTVEAKDEEEAQTMVEEMAQDGQLEEAPWCRGGRGGGEMEFEVEEIEKGGDAK